MEIWEGMAGEGILWGVCMYMCMYVYVCVCMCMYVYVCVCDRLKADNAPWPAHSIRSPTRTA